MKPINLFILLVLFLGAVLVGVRLGRSAILSQPEPALTNQAELTEPTNDEPAPSKPASQTATRTPMFPIEVTPAMRAQWADPTVQSNAQKAGTQAANRFAKQVEEAKTNSVGFPPHVYPTNVNLDGIVAADPGELRFATTLGRFSAKTLQDMAYIRAYLNAGGDPNITIPASLNRIGEQAPLLHVLISSHSYFIDGLSYTAPYFPKPLMDLIALFAEKGYTNWTYPYFVDSTVGMVVQDIITLRTPSVSPAVADAYAGQIRSNENGRVYVDADAALEKIRTFMAYGVDIKQLRPIASECVIKWDSNDRMLIMDSEILSIKTIQPLITETNSEGTILTNQYLYTDTNSRLLPDQWLLLSDIMVDKRRAQDLERILRFLRDHGYAPPLPDIDTNETFTWPCSAYLNIAEEPPRL